MIWVCKTILSKVLDKCYFFTKKIVEAFSTPTNIIEPNLISEDIYMSMYCASYNRFNNKQSD